MKKTDLSELLSPEEWKKLQDLEESCGDNATKAALILCLTQIQELLEMDPLIVKNQITDRVKLALFHASTLPKEYSTKKGHQAANETGVFPLPVEEKLTELEVRQFIDDLQEKLRTTKRSDLVKERIASLKEANAPKEQIENYEKLLVHLLENGL